MLVDGLFIYGEWDYEVKFDGYCIFVCIDGNIVCLFSCNGCDWMVKLLCQVCMLCVLGLCEVWFDGEVVVMGECGVFDFQVLQNVFEMVYVEYIVYYLFDIFFCNGMDLCGVLLCEWWVLF